jgi:hypothetical protein
MREAILRPAARRYYDLMSEAEAADIDRRIARLERDPGPDGITILEVRDAPGLYLYDDGTWEMYFLVPDETTIAIRSIAHALDLPD